MYWLSFAHHCCVSKTYPQNTRVLLYSKKHSFSLPFKKTTTSLFLSKSGAILPRWKHRNTWTKAWHSCFCWTYLRRMSWSQGPPVVIIILSPMDGHHIAFLTQKYLSLKTDCIVPHSVGQNGRDQRQRSMRKSTREKPGDKERSYEENKQSKKRAHAHRKLRAFTGVIEQSVFEWATCLNFLRIMTST